MQMFKLILYKHFSSRQLNAAALIQSRHENVPEFRALLKNCQMQPIVKGLKLDFNIDKQKLLKKI